jgi:hypothetical protein
VDQASSLAGDDERKPAVGTPSFRRLHRRRSRQEIDDLRALWELRFYVWGKVLACGLATVQAAEVVLALIEGRQPHLLLPMPEVVRDWLNGDGG